MTVVNPTPAGPVPGIIKAQATKTANYTLTANDAVILANATSAAFAVTLPTAVGVGGTEYIIKAITTNANIVTVETTSAQTIDGKATVELTTTVAGGYSSITVVSDGANWRLV